VRAIERYPDITRDLRLFVQLRFASHMPPNLRVKRRPTKTRKTCGKCGRVLNSRGFENHITACYAKHPTADTAADTGPGLDEHGTSQTPQPLTTRSDIQIADDPAEEDELAEEDNPARDDEIFWDLNEVDAGGSGEPLEAGGSGK